MAVNQSQVSDLIAKLWNRTQNGSLTWEQILTGGETFQARQGDFVISISKSSPVSAVFTNNNQVDISIKKLDGKIVFDSLGRHQGGLLANLTGANLSPELRATLHKIYTYLSSRDTDLDDLLKIL